MPSNEVVAGVAGMAAGAALYALLSNKSSKGGQLAPVTPPVKTSTYKTPSELSACESLSLCGTMLLCTQNLAVSGANQVLLNLAEGYVWRGNTVLLSPSVGPFAKEFADLGVAVFIGELDELLKRVTDVRIAICNTIMTAHLVCALGDVGIPSMWILHEWWPGDMLVDELTKRNDKNTTPAVVKRALDTCPRTACVCAAQKDLYMPANGAVTFVGVPEPKADWKVSPVPLPQTSTTPCVTFLCLGIVCPRKNQHWAVEIFRKWAGSRKDVRLIVVGARCVRPHGIGRSPLMSPHESPRKPLRMVFEEFATK